MNKVPTNEFREPKSQKPRIDLILTGTGKCGWSLGQVFDHETLHFPKQEWLERGSAAVLFWDPILGQPSEHQLLRILLSPTDLWHAGLLLGSKGLPGTLDFIQPTWVFNRDPSSDIEASSWRVSLRACLVRTEVVRQIGFLHPKFKTLEAAALEWGHRLLVNGVIMRHVPSLLPLGKPGAYGPRSSTTTLPFEDELRFVYYRFGRKWAAWTMLRALMSRYASLRTGFRAWRKVLSSQPLADTPPLRSSRISSHWSAAKTHTSSSHISPLSFSGPDLPPGFETQPQVRQSNRPISAASLASARVTVLIPTVDRYPYLRVLLGQLRSQTVSPMEVIVVDQTSPERRDRELAHSFSDSPVKWIYKEVAGQCSSRNAGLLAAKGDYILLLDDDVEIAPNLIEAHLETLHQFGAGASCGVAEEVGAGPLNPKNNFTRLSDVFPAGNTMVARSALVGAGLFDLAYDKGSRADADLGMRLYLSGEIVILNGGIQVLHHHAPAGGLRRHKARTVTAASSRSRLLHRNLPGVTEMYLAERYFSANQVKESLVLRAITTFRSGGGAVRKICKVLASTVALPFTLVTLRRNRQRAQALLLEFPQIPLLASTPDSDPAPVGRLEIGSALRGFD